LSKLVPITQWPYQIHYNYMALCSLLVQRGAICLRVCNGALLVRSRRLRGGAMAAAGFGTLSAYWLFGSTPKFSRPCTLDLRADRLLARRAPVMLAPGHPGLIGALLINSRYPKIPCVIKAMLMQNVLLGGDARLARFIRSDLPRPIARKAVADMRGGGMLRRIPAGTRSTGTPINPRGGASMPSQSVPACR
jgi:hypothetical protein